MNKAGLGAAPVVVLLLLFVPTLSGCNGTKEVLQDRDARQSLSATVALRRARIPAEQVKSGGGADLYDVVVPEKDYGRALDILKEYNLPESSEEDVEKLTRPESFAPVSPELSQLRLDAALARLVERQLRTLPGVIDAKVIVRAHLAGGRSRPGVDKPAASAAIRYHSAPGNQPFSSDDVKKIVAQAVPGVSPSDVLLTSTAVVIPGERNLLEPSSAAESPQLRRFLGFRIPEEDIQKAVIQLILYLMLFCAAGGIIGFAAGAAAVRRRVKNARRPGKEQHRGLIVEPAVEGQNPSDTGKYLTRRDAPKSKKTLQP